MARKKREFKFEFFVKPRGSDEFINRKDMTEDEWNSHMDECVRNFGETMQGIVSRRPELWDALENDGTLIPIEGIG